MALTKQEINKRYREKNKEKIREINRRYVEKNKEKVKEYHTKYREKNRKKINEYSREYFHIKKDGYHYVYLLEDYNYVGITDNIKNRFNTHKQKKNRDCTNYRILYKTKDRKEAAELEDFLHSLGYEGKNEGRYE